MLTLKFLLYVPYIGPVQQYIAMYCRTGIRTGTYNRNFRVLGDRFCAFKLIICPKRASSDQIFAKHTFVQCCRLLSTACYCSYALPGGSNDRREKKSFFGFPPLCSNGYRALHWLPKRYLSRSFDSLTHENMYWTHAIITCGSYIFHPLFEVHLCTVTFGLMYG